MKRCLVFNLSLLLFICFITNAQGRNEYLFLKGNIGSNQISMHLYKNANRYDGFYYNEKIHRPIEFYGIDSTSTGIIKIFSSYKGIRETFTLNRIGDIISGSSENKETGKTISIKLRVVNPPMKMKYINHEDSVKLLDIPEGYPMCKVTFSTMWPDPKVPGMDFLKDDIREKLTGVDYYKEDIQMLLKMLADRILKKYTIDYLNVSERELKASPNAFSMMNDKNLKVIYHSYRYISFAYREYIYSGGAHGNSSYHYFTTDKETRKILTLQSLFNRSALEDLLPLLEKYYLIEKGRKPGMSLKDAGLFENKISKNPSSCYVTDKGMGFIYNPYSIAPYSEGMIHIFVPYFDLARLINKNFAKSMNWL
jgi:hypothetical protein